MPDITFLPTLADRDHCSGCTACFASCPTLAISMLADDEGFLQPLVDQVLCVGCSLCEQVCPVLNPSGSRVPLGVYAAKANDDQLRMNSSSGGIFSLLAREVFRVEGIVYGAGWEYSQMRVIHKSAENENELADLRGSKYVQSDLGDCYHRVKQQLESGRQVMFSGTPCQIAGLRNFLRIEYGNLLCVDVICHGVPSPLVFQKYKEGLELLFDSRARRVEFRSKHFSWNRFSLVIDFCNHKEYLSPLDQDLFLRGFLSNLYLRRSCYDCRSRHLSSGSDITLADYWNVDMHHSDIYDAIGVSVILINTHKGLAFHAYIRNQLTERLSELIHVCEGNPSFHASPLPNPKREEFFSMLEVVNVTALIKRGLYKPLSRRVLNRLKKLVSKGVNS